MHIKTNGNLTVEPFDIVTSIGCNFRQSRLRIRKAKKNHLGEIESEGSFISADKPSLLIPGHSFLQLCFLNPFDESPAEQTQFITVTICIVCTRCTLSQLLGARTR